MCAIALTRGPVVEVGGGIFSTSAIITSCGVESSGLRRKSWTFEHNPQWFKLLYVQHPSHTFVLYKDIKLVVEKIREICPSVLFIDCDRIEDHGYPERRFLLQELWDVPELFVMHDTEVPVLQGPELWNRFKHQWVFKPLNLSWTTVASQTVNFGELMHRAEVTKVANEKPLSG